MSRQQAPSLARQLWQMGISRGLLRPDHSIRPAVAGFPAVPADPVLATPFPLSLGASAAVLSSPFLRGLHGVSLASNVGLGKAGPADGAVAFRFAVGEGLSGGTAGRWPRSLPPICCRPALQPAPDVALPPAYRSQTNLYGGGEYGRRDHAVDLTPAEPDHLHDLREPEDPDLGAVADHHHLHRLRCSVYPVSSQAQPQGLLTGRTKMPENPTFTQLLALNRVEKCLILFRFSG